MTSPSPRPTREQRDAERDRRDAAQAAAALRYEQAQGLAVRVVPGPVGVALQSLLEGLRTEYFTDEDGNRDYAIPLVGRGSPSITAVVDAILATGAEADRG